MRNPLFTLSMIASVTAFGLIGCSSTSVENPVDIITNDSYLVNIPDAEFLPSKAELQGKRLRVVVLPVKVEQGANFEKGAVREISSQIEKSLLTAGVEIVDRSLVGKLGDEIIAYEATGQFSGAGIDVADIAILPSVNNVSLSSSFSQARSWTDDDGKVYRTPSQCTYNGELMGSIKVYKMPELSVLDGIPLTGTASNNSATSNSNCPISTASAAGLAAKAAEAGVFDIEHQIQTHFQQKGFIIEYRKRGNEHLVNINLGASQGIKPGQKIQFARKIERYNRMTEQKSMTVVPYDFIGVVSDLIEADNAWVIVDAEAEAQVKFGDIARTYYEEKGFFDKVMQNDLVQSLTN